MATATIEGNAQYRTSITQSDFEVMADGVRNDGVGGTTAMKPPMLLDASLAGCIAMTVKMAADVRGNQVDRIIVEVTHEQVDDHTNFTVNMTLEGELSDKERAQLERAAHYCPIHQLLQKPITIDMTVT